MLAVGLLLQALWPHASGPWYPGQLFSLRRYHWNILRCTSTLAYRYLFLGVGPDSPNEFPLLSAFLRHDNALGQKGKYQNCLRKENKNNNQWACIRAAATSTKISCGITRKENSPAWSVRAYLLWAYLFIPIYCGSGPKNKKFFCVFPSYF